MGREKDGMAKEGERPGLTRCVTRGCSGPLRAHLQLLLLTQHPQQGHLLLVPGRDTQDLVPAGRHRGHREGTLGWGEPGEAPQHLPGLENESIVGVERERCRFRAAMRGKERVLGRLR